MRPVCVTVNVTGCGFDPHSRKWNICLNLYLCPGVKAKRDIEFCHLAECLNTRFLLPILPYAGYSVKLILVVEFRFIRFKVKKMSSHLHFCIISRLSCLDGRVRGKRGESRCWQQKDSVIGYFTHHWPPAKALHLIPPLTDWPHLVPPLSSAEHII